MLNDPSKLYRLRQFEAGHGDQYGIDRRDRNRNGTKLRLPKHMRATKRDLRAGLPDFFPDVYVVSHSKEFGYSTAHELKLLMAVIDQARTDLDRGPHNLTKHDSRSDDYRDAIAWFREIDPTCSRPFSLDWCCSYLQTLGDSEWNAERVRVAVFERERARQRERLGRTRKATLIPITSRALRDFDEDES